jgi:hypothetical protein
VLACGFTNTKAEFLSLPQLLLLQVVAEAIVERMEAPAVHAKRTYSIMMLDAGDATETKNEGWWGRFLGVCMFWWTT